MQRPARGNRKTGCGKRKLPSRAYPEYKKWCGRQAQKGTEKGPPTGQPNRFAASRPIALRSVEDPARCGEISEFGGQIPVDLKADADFDESRSRPDHYTFLRFKLSIVSGAKMTTPNRHNFQIGKHFLLHK
jgi:hypothetical protein